SKALKQFSDRSAISDWASGAVSAMAERKYVTASAGGRLNLKGSMTRAEMAEIMARAFRNVHDSGELTGTYRDTVLVRGKSNIHDATFKGDLILANSLRERELDLDDVTIEGRLIVWGGSEIRVNGDSTVAGVVTPRNDGRVRVIFDETASELSEEVCDVVYPKSMHKKNRVIFTEKEEEATPAVPAPTIGFELPQYLYVGDSMNIEATLTDAESVKWVLTKDGIEVAADGFTENGSVFAFTEPGRYVLQGTAENSNGSTVCEQSVEVLPVGDLAFSLSEYGYTDTAEDVNLLWNNGLSGVVEWTLTRDGEAFPLPGGFTLALSEVGEYVLTAKLTDAAGTQYTAAKKIIILPVLKPALAASVDRRLEGEAAEIGLTVESGETASIRWSMTR
ncbi:MAG: S-layer homology domain-containing protein, partial [Eubacteriales bacterium]|nr:S-layer homology domain-containing protein [Eubacteriales bacterium]